MIKHYKDNDIEQAVNKHNQLSAEKRDIEKEIKKHKQETMIMLVEKKAYIALKINWDILSTYNNILPTTKWSILIKYTKKRVEFPTSHEGRVGNSTLNYTKKDRI